MNKYVDNLTVKEYQNIEKWLKRIQPILNQEMVETGNQKEYVELRFTILKVQNVIKKYQKNTKNAWHYE